MSISHETIAIAIDFGTTFSGIAYRRLSSDKNTLVKQWPGKPIMDSSYKVPTVVTYPYDGDPLWGFEAEKYDGRAYPKMRVFKPFLEPMGMSQYRTPPNTTLSDVVHVYIQGLYTHVVQYIAKNELPMDQVDLNFLLTVPATYTDATIENFRRVVQNTGIASHKFAISLTEPEAASVYTMETMTRTDSTCKLKDCFMVCDAGGGTVDISSYNILQLSPNIKFEHTGVVTGKYCGSTMIDKEFISYLKVLIGEKSWKELGKKRDPLVERFISEKERFNDSENEDNFNINLGDIPCPGKKGPYLPISRKEMQAFFAISLLEIKGMISSHIGECKLKGHEVKFIFLVGGLGCSPYTEKKVREYAHAINTNIQVIKPKDAWQAVVVGAVLSHAQALEQEDSVKSRICPKNYGIVTMKPYNERKNFEYEKYIDPFSGNVFAKDQITWLISKGDRITGYEKCIERSFKREFSQVSKASWNEILVEYSGDNLPYRVEPGVRRVCTLLPDLSSLPKGEFEKKKKKGQGIFSRPTKYYCTSYTIKIYVGTVGLRAEMFYKGEPRPELMKTLWDEE